MSTVRVYVDFHVGHKLIAVPYDLVTGDDGREHWVPDDLHGRLVDAGAVQADKELELQRYCGIDEVGE